MLKLLFLLLFVLSCSSSPSEEEDIKGKYKDYLLENVIYIRDPRVNLCFASFFRGTNDLQIILVPCEAVSEYIINDDYGTCQQYYLNM